MRRLSLRYWEHTMVGTRCCRTWDRGSGSRARRYARRRRSHRRIDALESIHTKKVWSMKRMESRSWSQDTRWSKCGRLRPGGRVTSGMCHRTATVCTREHGSKCRKTRSCRRSCETRDCARWGCGRCGDQSCRSWCGHWNT